MVDKTLYIQNLLCKIQKQSDKIIKLCQENSHLVLHNSLLEAENEKLMKQIEELKNVQSKNSKTE